METEESTQSTCMMQQRKEIKSFAAIKADEDKEGEGNKLLTPQHPTLISEMQDSCVGHCTTGYRCCEENLRCVPLDQSCSDPPSDCHQTCAGGFQCCPRQGNQCLPLPISNYNELCLDLGEVENKEGSCEGRCASRTHRCCPEIARCVPHDVSCSNPEPTCHLSCTTNFRCCPREGYQCLPHPISNFEELCLGSTQEEETTPAPLYPQCSTDKFDSGINFCDDWCNTPGRWGCGLATLSGTDPRNTDNVHYTCSCSGCNGC